MARLSNGFLGNASGKIGNVVFSKWHNLFTARQYQPNIQDANSTEQQKQRIRMMALLEFLKPINQTFVKFFNTPFSKNSTPWAKAIKDNISVVTPEGSVLLENLQLGVPRFQAPIITEPIYNPFIDQVKFNYTHFGSSSFSDEFIYLATSVLGKYETADGQHEFDVRHLMCSLPNGKFWSSIYDDVTEYPLKNFWNNSRLWLTHYDTYSWSKNYNPAKNISAGTSFQALPVFPEFKMDVTNDLVPVNAITIKYVWRYYYYAMVFTIDYSKTKLTNPAWYNLKFWGLGMERGNAHYTNPFIWDLANNTFEISLDTLQNASQNVNTEPINITPQIIPAYGFNGSWVWLYATYAKTGSQESCFYRKYQDMDNSNSHYPYFQQLFDCNLSHPASFILSGNQCGFSGSFDELFADFIKLYEQGIINIDEGITEPPPPTEYCLRYHPNDYCVVNVTGYTRQEDYNYYFDIGFNALLEVIPSEGFIFNTWTGNDAADVRIIDNSHFSILMSKNRDLSCSMIVDPHIYFGLSILPTEGGTMEVISYIFNINTVYYFRHGDIAKFVVTPADRFVFNRFLGTGASYVIMDSISDGHIAMRADYTLQPVFVNNQI
jgi:hypothetical protein